MRWEKIGNIFTPNNNFPWMISHASVPFVERVKGDIYKIFFSSRNQENKSLIGWVEININSPSMFKVSSE